MTDNQTNLGDLRAEQEVIRAAFTDEVILDEVKLQAGDFVGSKNKVIWDAFMHLRGNGQAIDHVTVVNRLKSTGEYQQFSLDEIFQLATQTFISHNVGEHAQIIRDFSTRRKAMQQAQRMASMAYDMAIPVSDVVAAAEQGAAKLGSDTHGDGVVSIRDAMFDVVDAIEERSQRDGMLRGVPTGFTMLDKILGGFQKSDMIIIAARPGMGKSALSLTIAQNAATKHNSRVAIFSLEMSNEQLVERMLSMKTGIDSHRLRLGDIYEDEWPIMMEAANDLSQTSIFIDDTPGQTATEIRSKARRLYAEHGLDMIIIDYMQLMHGQRKSENRQQEISHISRSLKELAKELDVPVVALSQLSRAVESRADKRPMLSDLRESGSIEQDSDVVMFIYREDYYIEDTDRQNIADIIVAKHRHGSTGTASLFFKKELTEFRDLEVTRTDLEY